MKKVINLNSVKATTISILLMLFVVNASATVWRVNNNPNMIEGETPGTYCDHCFISLQEAIDNTFLVEDGDTLHVEASTLSYGDILINRPITIIGPGFKLDENLGLQANPVHALVSEIDIDSDDVTISGVSVVGGLVRFLDGDYSNIDLNNCYLASSIHFMTNNVSLLSNVNISNNWISGTIYKGGNQNGTVFNTSIRNNYIATGISFGGDNVTIEFHQNFIGGYLRFHSGLEFYNNISTTILSSTNFYENNNSNSNIYNNIFVGVEPDWGDLTAGENYFGIPEASIFTTPDNLDSEVDLIINPSCAICELGYAPGSNTQVGIYGGDAPYMPAGIPSIPSIYLLGSNSVSYPGASINVEVSTRSNN